MYRLRSPRPIAATAVAAFCLVTLGAKMIGVQKTLNEVLRRPDEWYRTPEAQQFIDHIISWQNPNGGWWKKYDLTISRPAELPPPANDAPAGDTEEVWRRTSTFDNGATYTEMRILARAQRIAGRDDCRRAFERGLTFIINSQYPNGGWPQRFPLEENYGRHITFNDDAMTNVMVLLKDIADGKTDFTFVDEGERRRCKEAFDRGIDCILKCQITAHGKLTAWCQQHDEKTLEPVGGRAYELPSINGDESASITLLLMQLDRPDARVRSAINAAVAWFESAKITGKRVQKVTGAQYENGKEVIVVDDASAPPLWARFYDLETNESSFCGRDGIKKPSLDQISWERRNLYAWYGTWGEDVLKAYPQWKRRMGE